MPTGKINKATYCRKCGTRLTETNWYPSYRAKKDRVCRTCAAAYFKAHAAIKAIKAKKAREAEKARATQPVVPLLSKLCRVCKTPLTSTNRGSPHHGNICKACDRKQQRMYSKRYYTRLAEKKAAPVKHNTVKPVAYQGKDRPIPAWNLLSVQDLALRETLAEFKIRPEQFDAKLKAHTAKIHEAIKLVEALNRAE